MPIRYVEQMYLPFIFLTVILLFLCDATNTVLKDDPFLRHLWPHAPSDLAQREHSYELVQHQDHVSRRRSSAECTARSAELRRRIAALKCDQEFLKTVTNSCVSLVLPQLEEDVADCGTDRNGTFCGVYTVNRDQLDFAKDINRHCFSPHSQNCTATCRSTLEKFSERFGCCVSDIEGENARVLAPQLWQDCNVERPEPCANTPKGLSLTSANMSCTLECGRTRHHAAFCKILSRRAINIYKDCGDNESTLRVTQNCGFNDKGRLCAGLGGATLPSLTLLNFDDEFDNEFMVKVYNDCIHFLANGTCTSTCQETLRKILSEYGCCFNNLNTSVFTFSGVRANFSLKDLITSNSLWFACSIEPPGLCSLPENTSIYDSLSNDCGGCSLDEEENEVVFDHGEERRNGANTVIIASGVSAAFILLVAAVILTVATLTFCCYKKSKEPKESSITSTNGNRASLLTTTGKKPAEDNNTQSEVPLSDSTHSHTYDYISCTIINHSTYDGELDSLYELDRPLSLPSESNQNVSAKQDLNTADNIAYGVIESQQPHSSSTADTNINAQFSTEPGPHVILNSFPAGLENENSEEYVDMTEFKFE